jgi:hypothetical protein
MHYWRKHDFEALRKAAASSREQSPKWQDYADFCLDHERGLRDQAFSVLERFIKSMEREPFAERRHFVSWLMEISDREGDHLLIPYPLKIRIVEPTLLEWTEVEPANSEPHRWIGDNEHLEKAVELNPADHIAVKKLFIALLSQIGYATHELPFGYLGSASEDLAKLDKIETLLPQLRGEDDRAAYAVDIAEERYAIHEYLRKRS